MSKNDDGRRDEAALRAESERLKQEVLARGGVFGLADEMPLELQNEFLRQVLAVEGAGTTSLTAELRQIGIDVPPPATLSDAALTDKLWEIINGLASLRVFLERTNHLSDRALYELLHNELLPDEMDELGTDKGTVWHLDMIGRGSNEDLHLHLKYYADEEDRRLWLIDWPDDEMPPHEDPPYDRDRLLPAYEW